MEDIIKIVKERFAAYWHGVKMMDVVTPICDLIVESADDSLKFAVEVKAVSHYNTDYRKELHDRLARSIYRQGAPNIPVLLALYDEQNNKVMIGIVVQWRFQTPIIDEDIKFVELTKENATSFYDNIKAADGVIRSLSDTNFKVIKKISFTFKNNGLINHCYVLYLRDLHEGYRMNTKSAKNQQEEFRRFLYGIPEDEYPTDDIDKAILKAIKEKYPDSECKSNLLLFSSELKDLEQMIKHSRHIEGRVDLLPSVDISNAALYEGVRIVSALIDIYVDSIFKDITPEAIYTTSIGALNREDYELLRNVLRTVKRPKDILLL